MDLYGPGIRWIEIYSRGRHTFDWKVTPYDSFVTSTPSVGILSANGIYQRVLISVDWSKVPDGSTISTVKVRTSKGYGNDAMPVVRLPLK